MRFFSILFFLPLFILITEATAAAMNFGAPDNVNEVREGVGLKNNSISISYWIVGGDFEMEGGPPLGGNRWILDHPTDGKALLLKAEFRPTERISYDINIGTASIDDGTTTDMDIDVSGVISHLSFSTSSGNWKLFLGNIYLRAYKNSSASLSFSLGYLFFKSSLAYDDPNIVIDDYNISFNSWQERWLTYDLVQHGIRFGLSGEVSLDRSLTIKANAGIIPWLQVYYDGIRYPQRPPGEHETEAIEADGLGFDMLVSAEYATPYRGLIVTLGYRHISFKSEGRDKVGTPWAGSWEELSMDLKGPFAALGFSF